MAERSTRSRLGESLLLRLADESLLEQEFGTGNAAPTVVPWELRVQAPASDASEPTP